MKILGDARAIAEQTFPVKFGVVIADPPWPYRVSKGQGAAKDQYDLMADEEIYNIPVNDITTQNSILLLWATWPKLPEALETVKRWGFDYVSGFPWIKLDGNGVPVYGVGYWVRGCSEYILIARKGSVSAPRMDGFLGLMSPNLYHSRKPDDLHEYAETLPGPYLELFARRDRDGWYCFGNEVEDAQGMGPIFAIPQPEQADMFSEFEK